MYMELKKHKETKLCQHMWRGANDIYALAEDCNVEKDIIRCVLVDEFGSKFKVTVELDDSPED